MKGEDGRWIIIMVTKLCMCKDEEYIPARETRGADLHPTYFCRKCNRELTFARMDKFYYSLQDSKEQEAARGGGTNAIER